MAFTGAAIFGAVSSIAGAATAITPILTAGAAGAGIYSSIKSSNSSGQQQQLPSHQQPPPPNYTAIQAQETQNILRANQKRTKTILTNPLGETTGFTAQKKQLVGKLGL